MNLAAIHIRAKVAGLDREAYCALLFRVAGVRSAKELDEEQYKAVMHELRSIINGKKTPAEAKLWAVWYNELCPLLYVRFSGLTSEMFTTSPESSKDALRVASWMANVC